ncbi:hypothetical protein ACVQ8P_03740 [Dellaglioa sp. BT-FLS60]
MVEQQLNFDVDVKKTQEKVREFLGDDLDHYLTIARMSRLDIKSPLISDMPGSSQYGNGREAAQVEYADAVIEITGYSNSRYYKLKGAAFLYFAEGYPKQIKNLQVYKNWTVMRVTSEYNETEKVVK